MAVDLSGKVAAITGATSGIGEATARAFAGAGATVSLAGRREDRLAAVAERIAADGGRAEAFPTDVADEAAARAFVEGTAERLGGLDVLVNNAGVMLLGPVEGADTAFVAAVNAEIRDLIQTTPLRFDDDGLPVGYESEQLFGLEAADLLGRSL